MLKIAVALALVACVFADDYKDEPKKGGYSYTKTYTYYGKYPGKCGNDGLYYKDSNAFVFCSNGNSYEQPCAPGSKNSGYGNYNYGGSYGYRDFCDVNLVDQGYAAKRSGYGGKGYSGYRGDGYRGDGYRGDGYRGDGYRGDGYRGDGYRGDGYRGDGYRGDGYRGDGYGYRGDGYRGGYGDYNRGGYGGDYFGGYRGGRRGYGDYNGYRF